MNLVLTNLQRRDIDHACPISTKIGWPIQTSQWSIWPVDYYFLSNHRLPRTIYNRQSDGTARLTDIENQIGNVMISNLHGDGIGQPDSIKGGLYQVMSFCQSRNFKRSIILRGCPYTQGLI